MRQWKGFWSWFSRTLFAAVLFLAGLFWIVDPYENIPFSPSLQRAPAASNQRYAYPAVARDPAFDSLIVGTSTMRLLRPDAVNREIGGGFANLSMNSATAYEQMKIAQVFARNHRQARTLVVGIDVVWCEAGDRVEKYTFRRFPEWMYDENSWNDLLHLAEFKTFEVLGRQTGFLLGLREARYGRDGYRSFVPRAKDYDLERARVKIYGPARDSVQVPAPEEVPARAVSLNFPSHVYLEAMLGSFPEQTRKVLTFVPYHVHHQPGPGTSSASMWAACRERISGIAEKFKNTIVLDFMIPSPITNRDENYWDPLHYTNDVAEQLARLLGQGARGEPAGNGEYEILGSSR